MKIWLASIVSIGLLASCGKKKEEGPALAPAPAARAAAARLPRQRHDQRQRLDVPEGVPRGRDRVVHQGDRQRHDQLRRRRLGQGPPGPRRPGHRLAAAATAPYKDEDKAKIKGGEFVYVPILLGAITVSYNLAGVDKLQLSRRDDRQDLPARDQEVERPGDRRGQPRRQAAGDATSSSRTARTARARRSNFTLYLDKAAGAVRGSSRAARRSSGPPTRRPATATAASRRSSSARGAIGYVDLPDAKASGLKYAASRTRPASTSSRPLEAAQAAGEGIEVKDDLTFVSVNATGDEAYPITAPTWCMAYTKPDRQGEGRRGQGVLQVHGHRRPEAARREIDYAPLPKALQDKAIAQVDEDPGPDGSIAIDLRGNAEATPIAALPLGSRSAQRRSCCSCSALIAIDDVGPHGPVLDQMGFDFFTSKRWSPADGLFGALPFICGTLSPR